MADNKHPTKKQEREVVELYHSVSDEPPSVKVDTAIIAMAKAHLGHAGSEKSSSTEDHKVGDNKYRPVFFHRYRFGLASAASVLFVAFLIWQLQPTNQQVRHFSESTQTTVTSQHSDLVRATDTAKEDKISALPEPAESLAESEPEMLQFNKMTVSARQRKNKTQLLEDAALTDKNVLCDGLTNHQELSGSISLVQLDEYLSRAGLLELLDKWSDWDKKHLFVKAQQQTTYSMLTDLDGEFGDEANKVLSNSQFALGYAKFVELVTACY